jgi:Domain of unknown function (DUF5615)
MARLYADGDFPFPVVSRLRQLGHDVLTTFEAGRANRSIVDADQLAFATSLNRAILTRNRKDFVLLHNRSAHHAGIVSITDDPDVDGQARRIDMALASLPNLQGQHTRVNRPGGSTNP